MRRLESMTLEETERALDRRYLMLAEEETWLQKELGAIAELSGHYKHLTGTEYQPTIDIYNTGEHRKE